jgi:hypothetical protein
MVGGLVAVGDCSADHMDFVQEKKRRLSVSGRVWV